MADALSEPISSNPASNHQVPCSQSELQTFLSEVTILALRLRQAAVDLQIPGGLPVGGKMVMEVLARHGARTVPQIARIRSTSRQNIQVLVNRLEEGGHVELLQNAAHKRSPFVELTEKGKGAVEQMRQTEAGFEESLLPELSRAEVLAATEVLSRIGMLLTGKTQTPRRSPSKAPLPISSQPGLASVTAEPRDRTTRPPSQDAVPSKSEAVSVTEDLPISLL